MLHLKKNIGQSIQIDGVPVTVPLMPPHCSMSMRIGSTLVAFSRGRTQVHVVMERIDAQQPAFEVQANATVCTSPAEGS